MNKLIIAAATVACACAVQASSFNWSASGESSEGKIYNTADKGVNYKVMNNATTFGDWTYSDAVLFYATTTGSDTSKALTQTALLTAIAAGDTAKAGWDAAVAANGIASTTVSSSIMNEKPFDFGVTENKYNFYMAILGTDKDGNSQVLISDLALVSALDTGKTALVDFATPGGTEGWTKAYFADTTTSFKGAGWYGIAAQDVPEPTSGLLLLLGVAGLALRRRRA